MGTSPTLRERFEVVEQQIHVMGAPTKLVNQRPGGWRLSWRVAAMVALGLALAFPYGVQAKTFRCGAGDVPCLIAAINEANANGEVNTIRLAAGAYTLTAPDNPGNGLPVITSPLTITGRGADNTSIARDASAPGFRILQVAATGSLTLKRLTVRGGFSVDAGGGILNSGTLTLVHTTVRSNRGFSSGAGISTSGGMVTIVHSTIQSNFGQSNGGLAIEGGTVNLRATTVRGNFAQGIGGITNGLSGSGGGTVIITESAITNNTGEFPGPGGIANSGTMVITNTTIARNFGRDGSGGGGIVNLGGTLLLTNSTVAENETLNRPVGGGGITQRGGTVLLLNTILAQNINTPRPFPTPSAPDCAGSITSLGNNLIGDPTGCTITLQPNDLTGAPGLDAFTDNGRPGNGHFPLLPTSQAIDAGNDATCPRRDQLGRRRVGPCDIGAIEFRDRDDRQHDEEDDEPDADPAAMAQESQ